MGPPREVRRKKDGVTSVVLSAVRPATRHELGVLKISQSIELDAARLLVSRRDTLTAL